MKSIKTVMEPMTLTKMAMAKIPTNMEEQTAMTLMPMSIQAPRRFGTMETTKTVMDFRITTKIDLGFDLDTLRITDCDDDDALTNPGIVDADNNGIDNDCDGSIDEDGATDNDGDGFTTDSGDCDDTDATIYPGAVDAWYDGVDSNCDGANDNDQDGDGEESMNQGGTDCMDIDATINTQATEIWYDGTDQDCSGGSDYDQDGDGYGDTRLWWNRL